MQLDPGRDNKGVEGATLTSGISGVPLLGDPPGIYVTPAAQYRVWNTGYDSSYSVLLDTSLELYSKYQPVYSSNFKKDVQHSQIVDVSMTGEMNAKLRAKRWESSEADTVL
ncbi:hypothetical protein TNCV_4355621 [Trichonephila clavipes]|nr:hypothetical protein TNCV_4355621 [Trichonephila clavipes]